MEGVEGDVPREPAESGRVAAEPLSEEPGEESEVEASDDAAAVVVESPSRDLDPAPFRLSVL